MDPTGTEREVVETEKGHKNSGSGMPKASAKPLPTWNGMPTKVKNQILLEAGREASFVSRLTSKQDYQKGEVAQMAVPFDYWDWRGLDAQEWDTALDRRKKRVCSDRQRVADDKIKDEGYRLEKERWEKFKSQVNDSNWKNVKHIAVAPWMTLIDYEWIGRNLRGLKALDLSHFEAFEISWTDLCQAFKNAGSYSGTLDPDDLKEFTCLGENRGKWRVELAKLRAEHKRAAKRFEKPGEIWCNQSEDAKIELLSARRQVHEFCQRLVKEQEEHSKKKKKKLYIKSKLAELMEKARGGGNILDSLEWLGVQDWTVSRHPKNATNGTAVEIIGECGEKLKTLSIRGLYERDRQRRDGGEWAHEVVCDLLYGIRKYAPKSVKTIELRRSIEFLPYFVRELSKDKNNGIENIGLDIGAWIQVYPLANTIYHRDVGSPRPRFMGDRNMELCDPGNREEVGHEPPKDGDPRKESKEARYRDPKSEDFNSSHVNEDEDCPCDHEAIAALNDDWKVNTLPQMLYRLYHSFNQPRANIKVIPISPEAHWRSTEPIHPFALIQLAEDVPDFRHGEILEKNFNHSENLVEVFRWLNENLNWRPLFDWDWFMRLDKAEPTVNMKNEYLWNRVQLGPLLQGITQHFKWLRYSGIPLHLLIRCRSGLYWGTPDSEEDWQSWLQKDFTANLDDFAGMIDRLSIFYPLWNPLSAERLAEIDKLDPDHRHPIRSGKKIIPGVLAGRGQQMANKSNLSKVSAEEIIYPGNGCPSAPPAGEDADNHSSNNSDLDDADFSVASRAPIIRREPPLHILARRTAYLREAVGWQRFWRHYSFKLTSLKLLRVRWSMIKYADERAPIQTQEDFERYFNFELLVREGIVSPGSKGYKFSVPQVTWREEVGKKRKKDGRVWPAGRFVRRSWVWRKAKIVWEGGKIKVLSNEQWRHRVFTKQDEDETQGNEYEELGKARERAEAAAEREASRKSELQERRAEYKASEKYQEEIRGQQEEREELERDKEAREKIWRKSGFPVLPFDENEDDELDEVAYAEAMANSLTTSAPMGSALLASGSLEDLATGVLGPSGAPDDTGFTGLGVLDTDFEDLEEAIAFEVAAQKKAPVPISESEQLGPPTAPAAPTAGLSTPEASNELVELTAQPSKAEGKRKKEGKDEGKTASEAKKPNSTREEKKKRLFKKAAPPQFKTGVEAQGTQIVVTQTTTTIIQQIDTGVQPTADTTALSAEPSVTERKTRCKAKDKKVNESELAEPTIEDTPAKPAQEAQEGATEPTEPKADKNETKKGEKRKKDEVEEAKDEKSESEDIPKKKKKKKHKDSDEEHEKEPMPADGGDDKPKRGGKAVGGTGRGGRGSRGGRGGKRDGKGEDNDGAGTGDAGEKGAGRGGRGTGSRGGRGGKRKKAVEDEEQIKSPVASRTRSRQKGTK
ncbi:hypothetical protein K469DRAFT_753175 [Zopfia rhizophila CBS 207.26]|uniref:Uncharacterized protein n=1 Tax=Zopfia rhizophila CBS 207.26 TaxID=1314779 RepID=A0A6A6DMW3_9PEZI|nr:hypothetical protein K469DRAFT_753175 [Zopfia rhizophila CBS 207.26]